MLVRHLGVWPFLANGLLCQNERGTRRMDISLNYFLFLRRELEGVLLSSITFRIQSHFLWFFFRFFWYGTFFEAFQISLYEFDSSVRRWFYGDKPLLLAIYLHNGWWLKFFLLILVTANSAIRLYLYLFLLLDERVKEFLWPQVLMVWISFAERTPPPDFVWRISFERLKSGGHVAFGGWEHFCFSGW